MMRLRARKSAPLAPPLTVPRINSRVALLADGARYTARLDDIEPGVLVIAAPDVLMTPERPVLLEWRDPSGVWQLPTVVTEMRDDPFDCVVLRPIGPSECISESQISAPGGGMRVTARAIETSVFPQGARIPVTSLQLVGDRIAFWTTMPLRTGDHVELMARTADGATLQAGLVVASVHTTDGSWLSRMDCDAENPAAPAIARLVAGLLAAA